MRAIRVHSYGRSDLIQTEDTSRPSPKAVEAIVRVRAAGVNPVDWKIREGYLKDVMPKSFSLTLGQDFSGEAVELGEGVAGFKQEDEVFGVAQGSYAEYVAVPVATITKKPKAVDFPIAAAIPTPALTAYQTVMYAIQPSKDQSILIHGAAGGVGSLATQLAISQGARVIATASSEDFPYLEDLGVSQVIDFKTERFEEKLKDIDAVIDLVGGEVLSRSLQVIKKGGLLATTVGPLNEVEATKRGVREVQIVMSPNATDLSEIAKLVDRGALKIRLGQVMPLSKAKEAQDLSQSGRSHGKLVLKVA